MSRIRSKDTTPEKTARSLLHRMGYRFRLHCKDLPGKPDIVLPRYRTAIFVHGCFWHRHEGCKGCTTPKTNTEFWQSKFRRNIERDRAAQTALRKDGWRVIVIWECEVKDLDLLARRLESVLSPAPLRYSANAGAGGETEQMAAEGSGRYPARESGHLHGQGK